MRADSSDSLDAVERLLSEPIAIVGMGCRLPGGASSPAAYWDLLCRKMDAIREVPADRWPVDAHYARKPKSPGKMCTRHGGFLNEDIFAFDASFFEISPREAVSIDPQQRLLLEVAYEGLEDAGIPIAPLRNSSTGVFVGVYTVDFDTLELQYPDPRYITAYSGTGGLPCVCAGRLSYFFGLQGPSLVLDTACSSSLVSVHLAVQSLRTRECNLALAGGAHLMLSPSMSIFFSQLGVLSPDGRCKTFDAAADGFGRGEGAAILVLKRLSDALSDGDTIRAIIRGSAVNHDGPAKGLTVPNGDSQQALIRQALHNSRVSPDQVGFIEAHGTGTRQGDAIEVKALANVLCSKNTRDRPLLIGSVKTNIGHLESAAGAAGLIKIVLSLQHKQIPAHINFNEPNPRIPWEEYKLAVPVEPTYWEPIEGRYIAGISGFGISGTNAHIILEAFDGVHEAKMQGSIPVHEPAPPVMLPISARSPEALQKLAGDYLELLRNPASEDSSRNLTDIAYSASARRSHHAHRLSVVGATSQALTEGISSFLGAQELQERYSSAEAEEERPKLAFIFPGQGSQWLGMGRELLMSEPVFRESIEASDAAIREYSEWSVLDELAADPEVSHLDQIDVVQPVLFAIETALATLWRSWGVEPDIVVGHSLGEVAAAHVSGALSLNDAARVICARSRLLRRVEGRGAMAAVELSIEQALELVAGHEDSISVAVSNSPRSTVLAGDPKALDCVLERLESGGVFWRRIKVDVASHSPQMDPLLDVLQRRLAGLTPVAGNVPIYSTVSGHSCDGSGFDAQYWRNNLRQPVRFAEAIQQLLHDGYSLFVEISPHPVLLPAVESMASEHPRAHSITVVPSLRRELQEREIMLESLGTLYVRGFPIAWPALYPDGRLVPLPTYPWQRRCYVPSVGRQAPLNPSDRSKQPLCSAPETPPALEQPTAQSDELERLLYMHQWKVSELVIDRPGAQPNADGTWLVLAGGNEVTNELVKKLQSRGENVICIGDIASRSPESFDGTLCLDIASIEAWEGFLSGTFEDGSICKGIVVLWGLDIPMLLDQSTPAQLTSREYFQNFLALISALARFAWRDTPRLWILTRGAQAAGESLSTPGLFQAPLWGLGRTIAYEIPALNCTRVDLSPTEMPEETAAVADELLADQPEEEVALRLEGRYVGRLVRARRKHRPETITAHPTVHLSLFAPAESSTLEDSIPRPAQVDSCTLSEATPEVLRDGSGSDYVTTASSDLTGSAEKLTSEATYLLTGGLGGLGLSVASWMVAKGARHLVLVGRSGINTQEQRAAVSALENAGAEVRIVCADVCDRRQLEHALSEIPSGHPLRGVVHLAGVLSDGVLAQQTVLKFEQVIAPKILGAWNLHELTSGAPLDFFVMYSSVASLFGSAGQGNYSAGNAFLDALAHYRRSKGMVALSINWGPFSEAGLAASRADRGMRLQSRGMESLTPSEGTECLEALLASDHVQVGAVKLDLRQWIEYFPALSESSLLQELCASEDVEDIGSRRTKLAEELIGVTDAQRSNRIAAFLQTQLATILRTQPSRMSPETPLKRLGVDSLMGLELRNRIERALGVTLSGTIVWTYPTIRRLAEYLSLLIGETEQSTTPRTMVPKQRDVTKAHLDALSDEELMARGREILIGPAAAKECT